MNVLRWTLAATLAVSCAAPAMAWGPTTQAAVVIGAMRILSRDTNVPLSKMKSEIQDGASVSDAEMQKYIPNADISPVSAIETQIVLLQSVRGDTLDPYFAFRMGVLGKLVAQQTAPLRESDVATRNKYYADVDANVNRTAIKSQSRRKIELRSYLAGVITEANNQNELMEKEYEAGIGFQGLAASTLSADVSRSVHAVADVWFTILSAPGNSAARSQLISYSVSGLQFAVDRGNKAEIEHAYQRLMDITRPTADLRAEVGDLFYEAGLLDRAVAEYEVVLESDPSRGQISERIAAYYVSVGDSALDTEELETARDAYRKALEYNESLSNAQDRYNEAQDLIRERDMRMAASQEAIDEANALRQGAGNAELNGDTAEAISMLFEAQMLYATVTTEFPKLASEARVGGSAVSIKINELKAELVNNAESLSGSGSSTMAITSARAASQNLDRQLLEQLGNAASMETVQRVALDLAEEYIQH